MSRAGASKAAKEKTKPPPPPTPITATEIVPGKFNENDWNAMLEKDSSEDFIHDIVDEIIGNTMVKIYEVYLQKQLLPFTIMQAKEAILHIVEWQFLARDDGEGDLEEFGWVQDEEPVAAATDCWAQGSVPKTSVTISSIVTIDVTEEEAIEMEKECRKEGEEELEPTVPEMEDKVSDGEAPEETDLHAEKVAAAAEAKRREEVKKRKQKAKRKSKTQSITALTSQSADQTDTKLLTVEKDIAASLLDISSLAASRHSILKVQNGRPPGSRDVEFDAMGNVVSIVKFDAETFPLHTVPIKYHLTDPAVDAANARLEAARRGRPTGQKQLRKSLKSRLSASEGSVTGKHAKTRKALPVIIPQPPSLLDNINVAPGVAVTEFGRTKQGPGRYMKKAAIGDHHRNMQPVTLKFGARTISVSDLLDRDTPILRSMEENRPLPPIMTKPPSNTHVST